MRKRWSVSAEVRFLDRNQVIEDLRRAAAEARMARPEILRVFLFGSFVSGNWTADSDADLIVVVRREFPDLLDRSAYQLHSHVVPTDTLVYSESEFKRLVAQPGSFLAEAIRSAIEL